MRMFWFTTVCLTTIVRCSNGANILFITLLGAPSHHIWNEALVGGLLNNGHNITLLGHDLPKIKSPNYTVLRIEDNQDDTAYTPEVLTELSAAEQILYEWKYQYYMCELDLKADEIKILNSYSSSAFDLIVFDLGAGQCIYPLLDYFSSAVVIGVSPFALPPSIANIMGTRVPSYIPMYSSLYNSKMSLCQRMHNSLLQTWDLILKAYYESLMFSKSKEHFGNNIRSFSDIQKKVILLLTNNDPVLDYAQPYPPNVIPVGGIHIQAPNKLSDELQTILDNAKHGVIYFSMGSFIRELPPKFKEIFISIFSQLNQTVLWKSEETGIQSTSNVIVRKWFPQRDLLAHENVKLFISHAGGLSTQEAIYNAVPVLGLPVFVDQYNNAARIVSKGGGLYLNLAELTNVTLLDAINSLLDNTSFKRQMTQLSKLFKDQQNTPLERAVFWVEYILRHKYEYSGHLDPVGRHMVWYEERIFDIMLFIGVTIFAMILFSLYKLVNLTCKYYTVKPNLSKIKIKDN